MEETAAEILRRKQINVQINPNLEYMNSLLLTSRYNEITKQHIGYGLMTEEVNEYTRQIRYFFQTYLTDSIYSYLESLILNGFTFSRPVELMLSLGDRTDFVSQYTLSDFCIRYCGGLSAIHSLLYMLRDFERKTGYFAFWEQVKKYYDPVVAQAKKLANQYPYVSLLEKEYGKEQNSYHYVLSSLMVGNYGISFTEKGTEKKSMFSVFSTDEFSMSPAVLLHEFSHPFINPLTEKFKEAVKEYEGAYELLKQYKLPGYQSGYGDWNECVNEHFVRAMVIHLLKKCGLMDMADQMLRNDLHLGYQYLPFILEQYQYYDENRHIYPDFESFYPRLLQVFSLDIEHDVAIREKFCRLGSMKGQKFIADGHDIEEYNDEIARLFEVEDG